MRLWPKNLPIQRQNGGWFSHPEHRSIFRRALWRMGFDPLMMHERLAQTRTESAYWQDCLATLEKKVLDDAVRLVPASTPTTLYDQDVPNHAY